MSFPKVTGGTISILALNPAVNSGYGNGVWPVANFPSKLLGVYVQSAGAEAYIYDGRAVLGASFTGVNLIARMPTTTGWVPIPAIATSGLIFVAVVGTNTFIPIFEGGL